MHYNITITAAELEVVALALGRMLAPRAIKERGAAPTVKAYSHGKPPKLSDKQLGNTERRWREAVKHPQRWHAQLAMSAGKATNRNADDVMRAWGLAP